MNRRLMILWLMLGILMLQMACESPVDPGEETQGTTRIHGVVIRNDNLSVVPDVVVHDITGRPIDTTKSDGKFVLTYQLTSPYVGKIIAKRQGFGDDTANVSLVPGRDTSLVMRVKATASSPATGGTGKAANIVLISTEEVTISVRGTGGNETASMLFEVRDSLGLPVGGANKVQVTFAIQGGPGGEEYLYPLTSFTDALTGRVTTKITSGTKAGVVQVFASATIDNNTIKSRPVRVLIAGGFPEAGRFSLSVEKFNMPAIFDNVTNKITAAVADKHGNPVQNVAVYFSTTSGDIDAGGLTDNSGRISSTLRTSGTRPANGIATVTATTVGDSGITISQSIPIVFSGASQIIGPQTSFVIADSGKYDFTFKVQDANGRPLSAGTTVNVTLSGDAAKDLKIEGDANVTIPDTQDPKYTNYSISVHDTKVGGSSGPIIILIEVKSPNGNIQHKISGTLLARAFPDMGRLSVIAERVNMPAVLDNVTNKITATVADNNGNPVHDILVVFSTTSGDIDLGGVTDAAGRISTTLRTSGTRPANGITTVSTRSVKASGATVTQSIPIIFSGRSQIIAPQASFTISDSGAYDFTFKVQDAIGHPLASGTAITVSVTGDAAKDLKVEGDASVTIPDTQDPKYTSFSARIRDTRLSGSFGPVTVVINVASPNGNTQHKFNGTLLSSEEVIVPPTAREPAQISFGGVTATAIDVAGVGGLENSVITYIVRDSLGKPIDGSKRVFARFNIQFFPNSYVGGGTPPRVIPSADSSDNLGQLRASIISGTQAGVVQLVARVDLPNGNVITSEPVRIIVRAGDPTQSHFTFFTNSFVFATFPGSKFPTFFVQVADTFSNPVTAGTAVYFHSWAGAIQASANTDLDGRGSVSFLGGNPAPTAAGTAAAGRPTFFQREGVLWVVAQTAGKNGKKISDSLRVVWAAGPITVTGIPTTPLIIPRGSVSAPVNVTIKDGRGNPLPVGTKISVKIDFTSDVSGIKFGVSGDFSTDESFVMPNGPWMVDPGPGITDFTFRVTDLSTGGGATVGQSVIVKIIIDAPNIGIRTVSFGGVVQ